jgi:hypothetical protein
MITFNFRKSNRPRFDLLKTRVPEFHGITCKQVMIISFLRVHGFEVELSKFTGIAWLCQVLWFVLAMRQRLGNVSISCLSHRNKKEQRIYFKMLFCSLKCKHF